LAPLLATLIDFVILKLSGSGLIYIFIHQQMMATKQIRKKKLDSEHNIENTVTYTPYNIISQ